MNVDGKHYQTIWIHPDDPEVIQIIDQRSLPHQFVIENLKTVDDVATVIRDMHVRGAGLIGATAGFGMYLAMLSAPEHKLALYLEDCAYRLKNTRPTAVNLSWAIARQLSAIHSVRGRQEKIKIALDTATQIADEDALFCKSIGIHGLQLIKEISERKAGNTVNILTHCNAGWLAFVDHGSATAPIYAAHDANIPVHVWVDETRPRNQGARLTAWELGQHGVSHAVIADNTGGHLMQHGKVDLVLVGSDRTTYTGDVANKIGTYLKALAARDNDIPFYVALPSSSIDWEVKNGLKEIPIEERSADEVKYIQGRLNGETAIVLLTPESSGALNIAFDVTPARLVTGLITERGICAPDTEQIYRLFPERKPRTA
jgi:methylthioribose-1-phosphate isomerase